jgi:hypothetical protein
MTGCRQREFSVAYQWVFNKGSDGVLVTEEAFARAQRLGLTPSPRGSWLCRWAERSDGKVVRKDQRLSLNRSRSSLILRRLKSSRHIQSDEAVLVHSLP